MGNFLIWSIVYFDGGGSDAATELAPETRHSPLSLPDFVSSGPHSLLLHHPSNFNFCYWSIAMYMSTFLIWSIVYYDGGGSNAATELAPKTHYPCLTLCLSAPILDFYSTLAISTFVTGP